MRGQRLWREFLLVLLLVMLVFPLAVLVVWAFARSWPWPGLWPSSFSLAGWRTFFSPTGGGLAALGESVLLALAVTGLSLAISVPAARAMALYDFPGKGLVDFLILAPVIVPPISVALGIHMNFIRLGLADTFVGVVLVHLIPCLPYGIRILTNVFRALGWNMEIQARVLGAGPWQTFVHVTLPLIAPGLASAGSLLFVISMSQYLLTFLIGGGHVRTLTLMLFPFVRNGERNPAAVFSLVFIATSLFFCIMMEKVVSRYYRQKETFYL